MDCLGRQGESLDEGSQLMRIRGVTANSTWITAWGLTRKHPHVWWPGCHRPGLVSAHTGMVL